MANNKFYIAVSILCISMLLLAILPFPISYYYLLRAGVCIGAIIILLKNIKQTHWIILFGIVALLFNPIFPIYLYKKSIWIPLDIIIAILFLIELLSNKSKEKEKEISKKEIKTYQRDRIYK